MNQRHVLITGSSRGIGRSTALYFAGKGYHVFLNCSGSLDKLEEVKRRIEREGNGSCTLVPGNAADPNAVRLMFQKIYSLSTHLDILINNAGVSHIGLLMDMSDDALVLSSLPLHKNARSPMCARNRNRSFYKLPLYI